jgi:NitT/TauT family transport system permease protein
MTRQAQRRLEALMPWLATIGMFVLWEGACWLFAIQQFVLPRPSVVMAVMYQFAWPITEHSLWTLGSTVLGFAIAVVFGLLVGLAIGASRLVYNGLYPLLIAFNSIPKVAVVPILILWFGIGTVPAVITAFIISFFPIVVNVATGLATIEPEMRDVLRSLGASNLEVLRKVGIPRAMPYLFASLKIAITLAFVGSVLSETVGSNKGIGNLMQVAAAQFNVPLAFAGLIVVAVMGIAMYAVCLVFERRMTGWAFRGQIVS